MEKGPEKDGAAEGPGLAPAELEGRRTGAGAGMEAADPERALAAGWEELFRPDGAAEESRTGGGAPGEDGPEPYGLAAAGGGAGGGMPVRPEDGGAEAARLIGPLRGEYPAADRALDGGTAAERGLAELYRQTAQAARPALPPASGGGMARTDRAGEPGRSAGFTVDELDRAVRRDSRRYDGGLSIF